MFYTVYKITNIINNRYYIGVHKTNNPMDGYYGSGIIIKDAISKYGKENFKKEILHIFNNSTEAYAKEKEIVNEAFISDPVTYNMQIGGIPTIEWTEERKLQASIKLSGVNHPMYGKKYSEEHKRKIGLANMGRKQSQESIAKGVAKRKGMPNPRKGSKLTEEDKKNKSIAALAIEKLTCPHCEKICDPGNAKRFHFDNCKLIKQKAIEKINCPYCDKVGQKTVMYRWHFENCKLKIL